MNQKIVFAPFNLNREWATIIKVFNLQLFDVIEYKEFLALLRTFQHQQQQFFASESLSLAFLVPLLLLRAQLLQHQQFPSYIKKVVNLKLNVLIFIYIHIIVSYLNHRILFLLVTNSRKKFIFKLKQVITWTSSLNMR